MRSERYIAAPGVGGWLTDLFTPAGTTASIDAAKEVTAKLEAQCRASGGTLVGTKCTFPTGAAVDIPQPEDVVPGVTGAKAKVEQTVADMAKKKATEGAKAGATQVLVVSALVLGIGYLLLRK
jgi:hypothetical protein